MHMLLYICTPQPLYLHKLYMLNHVKVGERLLWGCLTTDHRFCIVFHRLSSWLSESQTGPPTPCITGLGFTSSPTVVKRETELAGLLDHKCLCRGMARASWFSGRQAAAGWWGWRWGSSVIILVQNAHAQQDPYFFPSQHASLFHHHVVAHPKGPHSSGSICACCWGHTSAILLLN